MERVEQFAVRHVPACDRLCRIDVERSGEDRQPVEEEAFDVRQEVVAPLDGGRHVGVTTGRHRRCGEERELVAEASGDL